MNYRIVLFLAVTIGSLSVFSSPKEEPEKNVIKNEQEISFDEILVQGKHHFSEEPVETVKQDRVLDTLLEIPKDFKDRIKMSSVRN